MKVFGLVFTKVTRMPKFSLFVEMDDVLVLVHAADAIETAAAKVTDERPNFVVRVLDVKLLKK